VSGLPRRARADYNARVPSPGERLIALVRAEPPDRAAIAAFLDGLRVAAITALSGPRLQARLYAMVDYMRRVARDVFIGSAHRGGKETGNYFVLCREE